MIGPAEIRAHYRNAGFSRRGYAAKLEIHEQSLRRLERGESVHPATAKAIADDMGVQVTDLMPVEKEAA